MEDINHLIGMSYQMGLEYDRKLEYYLPNATKCSTWHDVKMSHHVEDQKVVAQLDDIYGMVILLAMGLGGAVTLLAWELLTKGRVKTLLQATCRCLFRNVGQNL